MLLLQWVINSVCCVIYGYIVTPYCLFTDGYNKPPMPSGDVGGGNPPYGLNPGESQSIDSTCTVEGGKRGRFGIKILLCYY